MKEWRTGPSAPQPTRVSEPVDRWSRQARLVAARQGPRHRRLDRRDVAHHDDVGRPGSRAPVPASEQLVAGRAAPAAHLGQGLARRRAEGRVRAPPPPHLGRHVAERLAPRARRSRPRSTARRSRPADRARGRGGRVWPGPGAAGSRSSRATGPSRPARRGRLAPAPSRSAGRRSGRAAGRRRWRSTHRGGTGPAPIDQRPPARDGRTRIRPHWSHVTTASGDWCLIRSISTERQAEVAAAAAVADQPGRADAAEARAASS